jgi:Domain of unknown function (DUF4259)
MGQWGESMFQSDGVRDFLSEFQDSRDFSLIENAVSIVLESDEYMDVDDCYNVIAAAEIIAAIKGNISAEFPQDFGFKLNSLHERINDELIKALKKALNNVLRRDGSELVELWEDEDFLKDYYEDLVKRVS